MKFAENRGSAGQRSGFELVLAALDQMIADGDREIARLKELLASGKTVSPSGSTPVRGHELHRLNLAEYPSHRQPDIVLPLDEAQQTKRRRAA